MASEELEFVENVPQEMICPICTRLLHEPQMVNCCEQHFCKDCLEKWLLENSQTCPHCRAKSFSYMFMKQKSRKIGELKVYCRNKQRGCETVLKYTEYSNHLSISNTKGCLYIQQDCPNNCSAKVLRGKMSEHMQKFCTRRIITCSHCKIKGEPLKLVTEHVNKCPLRPVACPLGCGANILPKDLQTHKNDCPLEQVICTFSELGCKAKVCRKDMKKHVESTDHMSMLAKSYMALREDHKILKQQYLTLTKSCAELQNKYATLQRVGVDK